MKTIYLYVLDTMADWEVGYATAELSSQRYFKAQHREWQVKACATSKKPIVTMGGMTIAPDCALDEVNTEDALLLILPGADTWLTPIQAPILAKARAFLGAQVPVAGICGATAGLAQAGMLDKVKHTSNGLAYLQRFCPQYVGAENYQDELAVTDCNLITAGSSSPVEFAYHILKKLNVLESADLEHWYDYFGKHSAASLMKLLSSTQSRIKESAPTPLKGADRVLS